jgi:hypothetical protein
VNSEQQEDVASEEPEVFKSFIMWQRWIALSGMPEALNVKGRRPGDWLVASHIIMQDHYSEGLKRARCGEGLLSFRWRHAELMRATGLRRRGTVWEILKRLAAGRWLEYVPGLGGRPSVFTVQRPVIRELYEYHAPRAPVSAFGVQGVPYGDKRSDQPRLVYGNEESMVKSVILTGMDMVRLWKASRDFPRPEFADVGEVRAILGV